MDNPYTYNHEDLIFEVYIRSHVEALTQNLDVVREELFQKSHPCMRASTLPKKYGWGVHYDAEGKIAIYGMETPEYVKFSNNDQIQHHYAMRSKRK